MTPALDAASRRYTVSETASRLGVSRDVVYDLMRTRKLAYIQVSTRRRFVTADQLDAYIRNQTVGG